MFNRDQFGDRTVKVNFLEVPRGALRMPPIPSVLKKSRNLIVHLKKELDWKRPHPNECSWSDLDESNGLYPITGPRAIPRNSASALERATTFCFLLLQNSMIGGSFEVSDDSQYGFHVGNLRLMHELAHKSYYISNVWTAIEKRTLIVSILATACSTKVGISSKYREVVKIWASGDKFPLAMFAIEYLDLRATFLGVYLFGGTPLLVLGGSSYLNDLSVLCLDRHLSDHRSILLRETNYDYGPSPFRFFHSWFVMEGFNSFVETTWKSLNIVEPNGLIRLKKKLQALKIAMKAWSKEANKRSNDMEINILQNLSEVDKLIDHGKNQVQDLECTVTYEEVKKAVWDCGTNKSPGPNGFSFEFYPLIPKIQDAKFVKDFRPISLIGSVNKIIAKILANRLCVVLPYLISDVQSTFVANRQILDGPFILNELLSWCKFKKLNGMIFKVEFEKAFDFVKWDYLDETVKTFGFGSKWRNWISSCLNNAMGSVLVNSSPTLEFQFHEGLKQGDPISHFLLILIMKTLHLTFKRVLNAGLYKGISLNDSFTISHLFYADDVVFIGGRLYLLKSVLTSIRLYRMSIFKVPIGVLNHLESIRRNFFYGVDGSDRKLAWIG
uniref:RNA-directed DNA polymerase, eukaryota, reverse transcriptase zinc-binding domain protein n=1 Tax=Tanacetum cinerariifolium TaxID=118510 RepID=A0A6L2JHA9_TANCI|nr:RNA-directed DNA polymerase, eukaryota, reverse transcriptase zinc-binding domain protein [Tanacetum cinerariifolium]